MKFYRVFVFLCVSGTFLLEGVFEPSPMAPQMSMQPSQRVVATPPCICDFEKQECCSGAAGVQACKDQQTGALVCVCGGKRLDYFEYMRDYAPLCHEPEACEYMCREIAEREQEKEKREKKEQEEKMQREREERARHELEHTREEKQQGGHRTQKSEVKQQEKEAHREKVQKLLEKRTEEGNKKEDEEKREAA